MEADYIFVDPSTMEPSFVYLPVSVPQEKGVKELVLSFVMEGKIELTAACDGLFRVDSQRLLDRKEEFLTVMRTIRQDRHFNTVVLMITDVLLEGTQLLFVGDRETIRQAFNVEDVEDVVFLPKIMSRKKQVIPMLSALWG